MELQFGQFQGFVFFVIIPLLAGTGFGAEDDFEEIPRPVVAPSIVPSVTSLSLDNCVFGEGPITADQRIESQIRTRIVKIVAERRFSDDQLNRIELAARRDRRHFLREIDQLRQRWEIAQKKFDLNDLRIISRQATTLRKNLLRTDSFFEKVVNTMKDPSGESLESADTQDHLKELK